MSDNNSELLPFPWGYKKSFIIASGILCLGILSDVILKNYLPDICFPYNIVALSVLITVIISFRILSGRSSMAKWLCSVPASLSAIVLFVLLSLMIALIPQQKTGINFFQNITCSWTYLFSYAYLLLVLGTAAFKRIHPFRIKNTGFILNHLGLWITLVSAGFGSGDIQKLNMCLKENETTCNAYDKNKKLVGLPFSLKLKDFDIIEYNPKFAIVDNSTGKAVVHNGKPLITEIGKGNVLNTGEFKVVIREFYSLSYKAGNTFMPVNNIGASPSALVEVNSEIKGWITCGSFLMYPQILKLNDKYSVAMAKPEPERFLSYITVYEKTGKVYNITLEVNKPFSIQGWKVYQKSYDKRLGKWSDISVLELVKDPWLPFVYTGCIMMLLGSVFMIYQGKNKTS